MGDEEEGYRNIRRIPSRLSRAVTEQRKPESNLRTKFALILMHRLLQPPDQQVTRVLRTKEKNMCGIVGYVGQKSAVEVILPGLAHLEYRGYDSAGIATLGQTGIAAK